MSELDDLEQEVLRHQTSEYIKDAPFTVRLVPYPETKTAAGGRVRNPGTPRVPQTFRLVPLDRMASATNNVQAGRPADGVERRAVLEILGEYDLVVERGDQFVHEGTTYEVIEIQPSTTAPYLRRAIARGIPDS